MTLARRLLATGPGRSGAILLVLLLLAAVLLPPLLPDPLAQPDLAGGSLRPPHPGHLLGTDALSRDVLARVIVGARHSLTLAVLATLVSTLLGTLAGVGAAAGGPVVDAVVMRIADGFLMVPRVLLLLLLATPARDTATLPLALAIGVTGWAGVARIARAAAARAAASPFATAAEALGATRTRIARRHLLPHAGASVAVHAAFDLGQVMLLESGLAFLGLGLPAPAPTWGAMLAEARPVMAIAPWTALAPGIGLALAVLGAQLLADGLRQALDPRAIA